MLSVCMGIILHVNALLDSLGEAAYDIPKDLRRVSHGQNRDSAGHPGFADSQGCLARTAAWIRHPAAHRADLGRSAWHRARGAISGSVSSGAPEFVGHRVGHVRE